MKIREARTRGRSRSRRRASGLHAKHTQQAHNQTSHTDKLTPYPDRDPPPAFVLNHAIIIIITVPPFPRVKNAYRFFLCFLKLLKKLRLVETKAESRPLTTHNQTERRGKKRK